MLGIAADHDTRFRDGYIEISLVLRQGLIDAGHQLAFFRYHVMTGQAVEDQRLDIQLAFFTGTDTHLGKQFCQLLFDNRFHLVF